MRRSPERARAATDMARAPIILGCASDHELPVAAVADALQRVGHAVELVTGVERDSAGLTASTDRIRGPALFVLCLSESLGRSSARRIEGLLSARKGPMHRVMAVEVPMRAPTSVVPAIADAAAGLVQGAEPGRRDDSGQFMRDVVVPTSVAAVPGAIAGERSSRERWSEPMDGVVEEPRGISDDALGLGDDTDVFDPHEYEATARTPRTEPTVPSPEPTVPPPEPEVLISTDPDSIEVRARLEAEAAAEAESWGSGVPEAVADDRAISGRGAPGAPAGVPRAASWDPSGSVGVERVASRVRSDPRAEADDRPLPSASAPIDVSDQVQAALPPPPPRRSGARLLLLLMAAAGMAGIIMMAVLHDSTMDGGSRARTNQRGVPSSVPSGAAATDADPGDPPTPDADAAGDGVRVGAASTSVGPAASSGGTGGVVEGLGTSAASDDGGTVSTVGSTVGDTVGDGSGGSTGEPEPGATTSDGRPASGSTGAGPDEVDDGSSPSRPEGGTPVPVVPVVPPPPNTAPSAAQLDAVVAAAIEQGRLSVLDDLLVLSTGTDTMTWDDALARCRRRKFDGIRGWKLPTKGVLSRLRKAKIVSGGTYWSRSVVGGDEAVAMDAGSGRMNVWLKMEPNARALCVRKRP